MNVHALGVGKSSGDLTVAFVVAAAPLPRLHMGDATSFADTISTIPPLADFSVGCSPAQPESVSNPKIAREEAESKREGATPSIPKEISLRRCPDDWTNR